MSFSTDEEDNGAGVGSDYDSDNGSESHLDGFNSDNGSEKEVEPEPEFIKKVTKKSTKPKINKSKGTKGTTSKKTTKAKQSKKSDDEEVRKSRSKIDDQLTKIQKLIADLNTSEKKTIALRKELEIAKLEFTCEVNGITRELKYTSNDIQRELKEIWGLNNLNEGTSHIKKEKELQYIKSTDLQKFLKENSDLEDDSDISIPQANIFIKTYLEGKGLKDENKQYCFDSVIKRIMLV